MAFRCLMATLQKPVQRISQLGNKASIHSLRKIGKREVVGHGHNGTACYRDNTGFPMPAVRFREVDKICECLRAKELLPWSKMQINEKKALYRYSFCQTLSEIKAPTGEWKIAVSWGVYAVIIGLWVTLINQSFLYDPYPITFDEEHQKAQLKRLLILEMNPVTGLSSKWDYENQRWKK